MTLFSHNILYVYVGFYFNKFVNKCIFHSYIQFNLRSIKKYLMKLSFDIYKIFLVFKVIINI